MTVSPEIQRIADTIRQAVPVEKIYLFGSYAYGTPHKDSDYDFYLIIPDGAMRPIEAMQEAQVALARNMRRTTPIDILASTRSSFDEMKNLITLERTIDRRGIAV
jgi:predicted nucleotidyltransferase